MSKNDILADVINYNNVNSNGLPITEMAIMDMPESMVMRLTQCRLKLYNDKIQGGKRG